MVKCRGLGALAWRLGLGGWGFPGGGKSLIKSRNWFSDNCIQGWVGTDNLNRSNEGPSYFGGSVFLLFLNSQKKKKKENQAERMVSSAKLNALLRLHPHPINVVVYHDPSG